MSFTYALNNFHDLTILNGGIKFVSGADEVRQRILVALNHYWQEYFLNVPNGVPWYEILLGSKEKKMVESILRRTVLDVPGVIGILSLQTVSGTNRSWSIYLTTEVESFNGTEYISLQQSIEG